MVSNITYAGISLVVWVQWLLPDSARTHCTDTNVALAPWSGLVFKFQQCATAERYGIFLVPHTVARCWNLDLKFGYQHGFGMNLVVDFDVSSR